MKALLKLFEEMPKEFRAEFKPLLEENPGNLLVSYQETKPVAVGVHAGRKGLVRAPFLVFVSPEHRREGLGSQLVHRLCADAVKKGSHTLFCLVEQTAETDAFLQACGLSPWFAVEEMNWPNAAVPEETVEFVPYQDEYYEAFQMLQADAFYELRRANDVQPYRIDPSPEDRKRRLENASRIFLHFEPSGLAAAGYAGKNGEIDDIAVRADQRGKGFGRALVVHAIRLLQQENCPRIFLHALQWNQAAIALYASLGFVRGKTLQAYRNDPEPPQPSADPSSL